MDSAKKKAIDLWIGLGMNTKADKNLSDNAKKTINADGGESTTMEDALVKITSKQDRQRTLSPLRRVDLSDSVSAKFLYDVTVYDLDWEFIKNYNQTHYDVNGGACSVFRKGNWIGRNLDFYYNDTPNVIVRTTPTKNRYASVGMTGKVNGLTIDFIESGKWFDENGDEPYMLLPFRIVDGINEKGLFAEVNVTPHNEIGFPPTTGTNPDAEVTICTYNLVRYILDNFSSCDDAVDPNNPKSLLNINIVTPDSATNDYHYMLADKDKTYVIEFVNNTVNVLEKTVMTNFHLTNTSENSNGTINYSTVELHGAGLERYDIIKNGINSVTTEQGVLDLLKSVKYSQTYTLTSNKWKTEFSGVYDSFGDLTINDPQSKYDVLMNYASGMWQDRSRDNELVWHTVHSAVYDLDKKTILLANQEDYEHTHKLSFRNSELPELCNQEPGHFYAISNGQWFDITSKLN